MNAPLPQQAVTGAGMDKVVQRPKHKRYAYYAAAALLLVAAGAGIWSLLPKGVAVRAADVRVAEAKPGTFNDAVIVRANAEALQSVILDSVESGRVEEVLVQDGAMVRKGQLLFRLSNPQRNLELLARQAERTQQLSNLSTLRVAREASRTDHARRLADLRFALGQLEKQHARTLRLAQQGFVSQVAVEESADKLAEQRRQVDDEIARGASEDQVKLAAVQQMEGAVKGLDSGLALVHATVDALAVRAPADGRLTGMQLKVGETVRVDQHIGRIDDPTRFKLVAQVDEFYLARVAKGRHGNAVLGDASYPVEVAATYPQIKEGRFTVDLVFTGAQPPTLHPGQGMDVTITLGDSSPALILPNGAWVNDAGGTWAFVVARNGVASRRTIKVGRRNASQVEILSGVTAGEQVIVSSYAAWANTPQLQLSK